MRGWGGHRTSAVTGGGGWGRERPTERGREEGERGEEREREGDRERERDREGGTFFFHIRCHFSSSLGCNLRMLSVSCIAVLKMFKAASGISFPSVCGCMLGVSPRFQHKVADSLAELRVSGFSSGFGKRPNSQRSWCLQQQNQAGCGLSFRGLVGGSLAESGLKDCLFGGSLPQCGWECCRVGGWLVEDCSPRPTPRCKIGNFNAYGSEGPGAICVFRPTSWANEPCDGAFLVDSFHYLKSAGRKAKQT